MIDWVYILPDHWLGIELIKHCVRNVKFSWPPLECHRVWMVGLCLELWLISFILHVIIRSNNVHCVLGLQYQLLVLQIHSHLPKFASLSTRLFRGRKQLLGAGYKEVPWTIWESWLRSTCKLQMKWWRRYCSRFLSSLDRPHEVDNGGWNIQTHLSIS